MNILSLFDGISCGQVALHRAGLPVSAYVASEISEDAITVTQYHYPNTIQVGDVRNLFYKNNILYKNGIPVFQGKINLVMGGSPCTDFSSVGTSQGMNSDEGEILYLKQYLEAKQNHIKFKGQSYLFWEYVRILNEIKPEYFLLENVPMAYDWQYTISDVLNTYPITIDSKYFSAQNRIRLYWTNIPVSQNFPHKYITVKDILDENASTDDVTHSKVVKQSILKIYKKYGYIPVMFNARNASIITDKACTLTTGSMLSSSCATLLFTKVDKGVHTVRNGVLNNHYVTELEDGQYNIRRLNILEMERLQTLPDNYTKCLYDGQFNSKTEKLIGNAWTVDVIAYILSFIQ